MYNEVVKSSFCELQSANNQQKATSVHKYLFSRNRLKERIPEFIGGQFLMKTKLKKEDVKRLMSRGISESETQFLLNAQAEERDSMVLRGEIQALEIPDMNRKIVVVHFTWLCERHLFFDASDQLVPKWVPIPSAPQCHKLINVHFISYYFPKWGKRLKMWTALGEYCRFYKLDDDDNLMRNGDEFVPAGFIEHKPMLES